MKELSIEEKAKRYDDAYKVVKNIHIFSSDLAEIKRMEEIFPELKEESEDERIKKRICKILWDNVPYEEAQEYIAWLEKQNEQKPVFEMKTPEESLGIDSDTYNKIVDECIYDEQKLANKIEPKDYSSIDPHFFKTTDNVEPKFKVGDWIVCCDYEPVQIIGIRTNTYEMSNGDIRPFYMVDNNHNIRLWTIQDAKPGDVLVVNNEIFIYAHRKQMYSIAVAQCFVDSAGGFYLDGEFGYTEKGNSIHPATKEQRDLLFSKMREAGYEWNAEKKELKKIEQKPAWSEEDDKIIEEIINDIECARAINYHDSKEGYEFRENWLESLKDRVQPQLQQGWTEEDERIIKRIDSLLYSINESEFEDIHAWLEFLKNRVQPKQEWSKEDEVKINRIVACLENLNVADNDILLKDVDWLKSLKDRVGCEVNCTTKQQWKPSDEQLNNILDVLSFDNCTPKRRELLESLYIDLKKIQYE